MGQRFRVFCTENNLEALPAKPVAVVLFLQTLLDKGYSYATLIQTTSAIGWLHQVEGLADPTKQSVVGNVLSAARRQPREVKHAAIATRAHLEFLAEVFRKRKDAKSLRLLTVAVTLFVGCLRLDEIMDCAGDMLRF